MEKRREVESILIDEIKKLQSILIPAQPKQKLAHRVRNAQRYSEKVFGRLIQSFVEYISDLEKRGEVPTDELIEAKIVELNDNWVSHCTRTPMMTEDGKSLFLQEIKRILDQIRERVILAAAGTPEGTPKVQK